MNLIFPEIYEFNFSEKNQYLNGSILGNNLYKPVNLILIKKQTIYWLLIQFWAIIYITGEFDFYEEKNPETLLTQFWVIIYIISKFNFYEKNKNFIESILGNNLHN